MVVKLEPQRVTLFLTNLYPLNVGIRMNTYYQYVLETETDIPADSKDMIACIIRSAKRRLIEEIGYFAYSNLIIWGTKRLDNPTLKSYF